MHSKKWNAVDHDASMCFHMFRTSLSSVSVSFASEFLFYVILVFPFWTWWRRINSAETPRDLGQHSAASPSASSSVSPHNLCWPASLRNVARESQFGSTVKIQTLSQAGMATFSPVKLVSSPKSELLVGSKYSPVSNTIKHCWEWFS